MTYEVSLNNKSCLFDQGHFDSVEEAVRFARHRSGTYSVNIGHDDRNIHLSYNSDTDIFSHDSFDGWVEIPNEKLIDHINEYI